jgi:RNAse (barnase) inhibitor barstar
MMGPFSATARDCSRHNLPATTGSSFIQHRGYAVPAPDDSLLAGPGRSTTPGTTTGRSLASTGLHDRRQIFAILQEELPLPSYFGQNWDALAECLKDLSWVREKRVALVHKELPHLSGQALALYLDVLADSAADWKLGDEHELLVVFPATAREAIETIHPA